MPIDNRFAPLPSQQRATKALVLREQSTGVRWTDSCPVAIAKRVRATLDLLTNAPERVLTEADTRRRVASDGERLAHLTAESLGGLGDDVERLDCVAAVVYAFVWLSKHDEDHVEAWGDYNGNSWESPRYEVEKFIEVVNDMLLAGRVEWSYEDGRFQERGNSVLHTEVIRPATVFLDSDPKFRRASNGFQTALNRLSENKPDVAITDAASAVQEFFRALGVSGNSISDQLNTAVNAKVISAADRNLLKPFVDWVNADRSTRGNAHHAREGDVSKADAWLMIHVAGALLVRLSDEEPRDIIAAREKLDAEAAAYEVEKERLERHQAEGARVALEPRGRATDSFGDETPF